MKVCIDCGVGIKPTPRGLRCSSCVKIHKKNYNKNYYHSNKDLLSTRNKAYRQDNKARMQAASHQYYQENRERLLERQREINKRTYQNRREYYRAKHREHYRANPDWYKARNDRHYAENKDLYDEKAARRRANQKQATPPWVDRAELRRIYRERPPGHEVDHIVPLNGKTVCGLHVPWNLQYLPSTENRRKSNRLLPLTDITTTGIDKPNYLW